MPGEGRGRSQEDFPRRWHFKLALEGASGVGRAGRG